MGDLHQFFSPMHDSPAPVQYIFDAFWGGFVTEHNSMVKAHLVRARHWTTSGGFPSSAMIAWITVFLGVAGIAYGVE
jgi:hypothetical protein